MSTTKGKWMIMECDLQIVWNCFLSEEQAVGWSGKRSQALAMKRNFEKEGWLVFDKDFCICPNCAEAIIIEQKGVRP